MDKVIENTTQKEINFIAFCVEIYKNSKKISGQAASIIFTKYHIYEFLYECYGAMHTTTPEYIIEELDEIISEKNNL
jgi:hypothetical protein